MEKAVGIAGPRAYRAGVGTTPGSVFSSSNAERGAAGPGGLPASLPYLPTCRWASSVAVPRRPPIAEPPSRRAAEISAHLPNPASTSPSAPARRRHGKGIQAAGEGRLSPGFSGSPSRRCAPPGMTEAGALLGQHAAQDGAGELAGRFGELAISEGASSVQD